LATRWLSPRAETTFIAFSTSTRYLRSTENVEIAGNPVDPRLATCSRDEARKQWDLSDDERVVLVTGGSSGARSVNRNIISGLSMANNRGDLTILWQTGRQGADWSGEAAAGWKVHSFDFTDHMTEAMVAADLIVARAGALTVSEITAAGKSAILVPYPYAAADHQTQNARALADAGAAVIIHDQNLETTSLLEEASLLMAETGRIREMSEASRKLARPDAADHIAERVIALGEQAEKAAA
jgi:UDP-N-acetylglucosamine--N-acetylmuramyl-(pentapeptide) pyrophosphoryl-undecaprenol N-acetylglucosamine transferase